MHEYYQDIDIILTHYTLPVNKGDKSMRVSMSMQTLTVP